MGSFRSQATLQWSENLPGRLYATAKSAREHTTSYLVWQFQTAAHCIREQIHKYEEKRDHSKIVVFWKMPFKNLTCKRFELANFFPFSTKFWWSSSVLIFDKKIAWKHTHKDITFLSLFLLGIQLFFISKLLNSKGYDW